MSLLNDKSMTASHTHRRKRLQKRHAMRRWRAKHPIMACWHAHLWNSKKRGVKVEWTYPEFAAFCALSNYHNLRKEGYQIHRDKDQGPYCVARCTCVTQRENLIMQHVYAKIRRWRQMKAAER